MNISGLLSNPNSAAVISNDLSELRGRFYEQVKVSLATQVKPNEFFFYSITTNNYMEMAQ